MKKVYFFIFIILLVASLLSCPNNSKKKYELVFKMYDDTLKIYEEDDDPINVVENTKFKDVSSPTVPDITYEDKQYTCIGWTDDIGSSSESVPLIDVSTIPGETQITKNYTLYAVYREKEKITATFRSYDGLKYKQDDEETVYKGIEFGKITKPQDPEDITYAGKNYEFKGWTSARPGAEDVPIRNQDTIDDDTTPINESTVFNAVYQEIQPFSVKFYKYNGSNYDYIETKDFTKKEEFKNIEKPEVSSFEKDGKKYVLKGWSETSQESGFLNDTVIVKRNVKINKDTSLYAVYIENYLTFTADKDTEIAFNLVASSTASLDNPVSLQYKKDEDDDFKNYTWDGEATSVQSTGGTGERISLLEGEKIYFKGNNSTFSNTEAHFNFISSDEIKASGNVMYLVNNQANIPNKGCFRYLFMNCVKLKTSPELPSEVLKDNCYEGMFNGCVLLTTAPSLPAKTLALGCYKEMFYACKVLETPPELPSEVLKDNCYEGMFSGCVLLTTTPVLPAETLALGCYKEMFYDCKVLETAPLLPASTLAKYCYQSMFSGCIALKNAPVLNATSLAENCYAGMFANCKSIETAPSLLAQTLAVGCYNSMFLNCTSLRTAPSLPAPTLADSCYYAMFSGCTALETAPAALSATTLTNNCYRSMFSECTSLTQPPTIAATTLAPGCCFSMFYGCTKLQSSPILYATTLVSECYYQMFRDCSSLNSVTCYAESLASNSTSMWLLHVASSGDFNCKNGIVWPSDPASGIPAGWTRKDI